MAPGEAEVTVRVYLPLVGAFVGVDGFANRKTIVDVLSVTLRVVLDPRLDGRYGRETTAQTGRATVPRAWALLQLSENKTRSLRVTPIVRVESAAWVSSSA